jgi:hypothetical protein
LARVRKYLAAIPVAAAGGRNSAAFKVAAALRVDFGLDETTAWGFLEAWNQGNAPPLDTRELMAVFESGEKYGKH